MNNVGIAKIWKNGRKLIINFIEIPIYIGWPNKIRQFWIRHPTRSLNQGLYNWTKKSRDVDSVRLNPDPDPEVWLNPDPGFFSSKNKKNKMKKKNEYISWFITSFCKNLGSGSREPNQFGSERGSGSTSLAI